MILKKIRYKKKATFDYFEVWLGNEISVFDHENFEVEGKFEDRATVVSTQICPWCVKKYGLYEEVERTPESIDEEIKFYSDADPDELFLFEKWRDEEAVKSHNTEPHFKRFGELKAEFVNETVLERYSK